MTADVRALVRDLRDALAGKVLHMETALCPENGDSDRDPKCAACAVLMRADAYLAPMDTHGPRFCPPCFEAGRIRGEPCPDHPRQVADPRDHDEPYPAQPVTVGRRNNPGEARARMTKKGAKR